MRTVIYWVLLCTLPLLLGAKPKEFKSDLTGFDSKAFKVHVVGDTRHPACRAYLKLTGIPTIGINGGLEFPMRIVGEKAVQPTHVLVAMSDGKTYEPDPADPAFAMTCSRMMVYHALVVVDYQGGVEERQAIMLTPAWGLHDPNVPKDESPIVKPQTGDLAQDKLIDQWWTQVVLPFEAWKVESNKAEAAGK